MLVAELCGTFTMTIQTFAAGTDLSALSIQDAEGAADSQAHQDSTNQAADSVKKARNLQKKLKQIQQGKQQRDEKGMNTLTPEQEQNIQY